MRTAPTNAAILVAPQFASGVSRAWKSQLPATLPLRPKTMSQSSPYPPPFMAIPASQPANGPKTIDITKSERFMIRPPRPGGGAGLARGEIALDLIGAVYYKFYEKYNIYKRVSHV